MLYSKQELNFFPLFSSLFLERWLSYKHIGNTGKINCYMDFWLKDKSKTMLVYKSSTFFDILAGTPHLIYRSKKQTFRHKFKPDTLYFSPNTEFLMNLRHFMFYGCDMSAR